MSRIVRNMLKSKRENRRKSESTCGVNILFEPFQEQVPDNSGLPKRVFLFIQEFLYMTVMSDMSRIVRNMFESIRLIPNITVSVLFGIDCFPDPFVGYLLFLCATSFSTTKKQAETNRFA